jgi:N-methylhydantoinase B/oxoprolinase/acetone carboxylase alpha subunit
LEECYRRIIAELQEEHKNADAEVFERRAQMVEMRKVPSATGGPGALHGGMRAVQRAGRAPACRPCLPATRCAYADVRRSEAGD